MLLLILFASMKKKTNIESDFKAVNKINLVIYQKLNYQKFKTNLKHFRVQQIFI